jgi:hypothetical protein
MKCLGQAAQLAQRAECWTILLLAITHMWNFARPVLNVRPDILTDSSPTAAWQAQASTGSASTSWSYPVSERSVPRSLRAAIDALLTMLEHMKSGKLAFHAIVKPAADQAGSQKASRPVSMPVADSEFSFGSDAPPDFWFLDNSDLDFEWINAVICMVLAAQTASHRPATVLAIAETWRELSEGAFDSTVLPFMVAAAPQAQVNVAPYIASLTTTLRDQRAVMQQLQVLRRHTQAAAAGVPILDAVPVVLSQKRASADRSVVSEASKPASYITLDKLVVRILAVRSVHMHALCPVLLPFITSQSAIVRGTQREKIIRVRTAGSISGCH